MPNQTAVVASAVRTSNGNSGRVNNSGAHYQFLSVLVDITAVGGDSNETLDLDIEWSADGGTTWHPAETADSFAQLLQTAGAQTVCKQFNIKGGDHRIVWVVGGTTPSFTFSIHEYLS